MQVGEQKVMGKAWRTFLLVLITLFFIFPILWTFSLSVKPKDIQTSVPPKFTFHPTVQHYKAVLTQGSDVAASYTHDLLNSVILAVSSTVLTVLVGTPAAYSLARLRPKRKDDLMMFILASRMAPAVALVIPFFLLFKELGLLETHLGLVIAYMTFNLSFYVWLLAVFAKEIPQDLEGAAMADGYGPFYAFSRVILPLMWPSIIACAVLVYIFAWNEFAFALVLGGQKTETLPIAIERFLTPSGVQFGPLAALGVIAILPVAIMVFVLYKHIVRGLSLGAVKG
jgi:multiple sugar transport system permease protein